MDDAIGVIIEPSSFDMLIAWLLFDSKVKGADEPRILGSDTDIAMATSDIRAKLFCEGLPRSTMNARAAAIRRRISGRSSGVL